MANPTRLTSGLATQARGHPRGFLPRPDPLRLHEYINDFDVYLASDWTRSLNAGTGTSALVAGDGGLLLLTNTAIATDMIQHQLTVASYTAVIGTASVAGKDLWFGIRWSTDTAALSTLVAGLHTVKSTAITTAATDGFWFTKAVAGTVTMNDSTSSTLVTSGTLATMANATMMEMSFHLATGGGVNELRAFIDGVQVYTRVITTPPTGNLALTFAQMNSSAVARTTNIDYVYAARER